MHARKRKLGTIGLGAALAAALTLTGGTATAGESGPTAPAGTGLIRNANTPGVIPGSYIVALEGGTSAHPAAEAAVRAQARNLVGSYGGTVDRVYSTVFRGFALKATKAQARKLAAAPGVRYVEADAIARAAGEQQNPPSWGIDRVDGSLNDVYSYPNEGSGVTVFVVDTGVDITHPNFEGRASSGYDFIDNDGNADDCHGHGTHVAGTVGSRDYGVAKKADIVAVRVLDCEGRGSWSAVIGGIEYTGENTTGTSIGNMSLGGQASTSVDEAVRGAVRNGVAFAVAAGNDNRDACGTSPARVREAITLGATTRGDVRSSFSNYGSCLDLFAPGSSIVSTRMGGGSTTMSGTSMASPHAAGAAALYLSAHPGATPQQIEDGLVNAAESGVVRNPGPRSPNLLLNVTRLG